MRVWGKMNIKKKRALRNILKRGIPISQISTSASSRFVPFFFYFYFSFFLSIASLLDGNVHTYLKAALVFVMWKHYENMRAWVIKSIYPSSKHQLFSQKAHLHPFWKIFAISSDCVIFFFSLTLSLCFTIITCYIFFFFPRHHHRR